MQEREERLLDTLQENEYLKRTQQDNELRIKRCIRLSPLLNSSQYPYKKSPLELGAPSSSRSLINPWFKSPALLCIA